MRGPHESQTYPAASSEAPCVRCRARINLEKVRTVVKLSSDEMFLRNWKGLARLKQVQLMQDRRRASLSLIEADRLVHLIP